MTSAPDSETPREDCDPVGGGATPDHQLDEIFQHAMEGDPAARNRLVDLACAGNLAAREYLARWALPLLREFARHLFRGKNRSPYGASDLLNSGLARAFQGLEFLTVRTGAGFLGWVRAILRHRFVDVQAHETLMPRSQGDDQGPGPNLDEISGDGPDPFAAALRASEPERIDRILRILPERIDRTIVFLRIVVELSHADIADHLGSGWNEGRVGTRFLRALRILRRHLPEGDVAV